MGFYVLCGLTVNLEELFTGYLGAGDSMLLSILACLYAFSRLNMTQVLTTVCRDLFACEHAWVLAGALVCVRVSECVCLLFLPTHWPHTCQVWDFKMYSM